MEMRSEKMNEQIPLQELKEQIDLLASKIDSDYFKRCKKRYIYIYSQSSIKFKKDMKILDIGSSPGHLAYVLSQVGCDVTAIDHEPEESQTASTIPVLDVNIEKQRLPFENDTFDVIQFTEVIEHLVYDPERALKEIFRVLKQNGVVICTTPNVLCLNRIIELIKRKRANMEGDYVSFYSKTLYARHNFEYTLEELKKLFKDTGFTIIKSEYYSLSSPPFIRRFYLAPIYLILLLFLRVFKSFRTDLLLVAKK